MGYASTSESLSFASKSHEPSSLQRPSGSYKCYCGTVEGSCDVIIPDLAVTGLPEP